MRQGLDCLVAAPVNEAGIVGAGHPFIGPTEYLSQFAGTDRTAMMLLGEYGRCRWLRVSLVTTHLPLRMVPDQLSQKKIERVIDLTVQACHDLQLPQSRIGVCGLNPHAGEEGELGWEDQQIIAPAVQAASLRHAELTGPVPADTLFYQAYEGDYDAVVAMYHDQGLGPLKMIGFRTGVNWTLGLPFIRTSPDHGTAYSLVGQNKADPSSMQSAIRLAKQLARNRAETVSDLRVG
jgi:4-hydroxythreonine-4-phosphate dehydrogenase